MNNKHQSKKMFALKKKKTPYHHTHKEPKVVWKHYVL